MFWNVAGLMFELNLLDTSCRPRQNTGDFNPGT